jgi:hypothetical protein
MLALFAMSWIYVSPQERMGGVKARPKPTKTHIMLSQSCSSAA